MDQSRSLRRRRGWLEVGLVGCSMLASPAQAAWPWSGTVWPSAEPHSASPQHHTAEPPLPPRYSTHHVTPAVAQAAAAAVTPTPQEESPSTPQRRQLRGHASRPRRVRPPPPPSSRALDVEITLHAGVGDWEECSMETCTQTRQVFCETADARIVASDLCGDELPAAERACVGKDAAVCGEGADGSAADTPGREAGAPPAAEEEGEAAAVGRGVGNSNRSDSRRPRSSAEAPAPKGSAKASKVEKGEGAAEGREGGEEDEGGGGAHESRKPSSRHKQSSNVPQSEKPSGLSTPESPSDPSLADYQAPHQSMAQMGGGGLGQHRLEYRFWIVLAIGAGAVGSFMAAVVFAVGQYRKEQHHLRGIMALNEFPQDNYINPFAKQLSADLSEDDRSAFKL